MPDNQEVQTIERLLTMEEVADVLQVSRTKAYALRKKGLPVVRLDGAVRVIPSRLHAWIRSREQ